MSEKSIKQSGDELEANVHPKASNSQIKNVFDLIITKACHIVSCGVDAQRSKSQKLKNIKMEEIMKYNEEIEELYSNNWH